MTTNVTYDKDTETFMAELPYEITLIKDIKVKHEINGVCFACGLMCVGPRDGSRFWKVCGELDLTDAKMSSIDAKLEFVKLMENSKIEKWCECMRPKEDKHCKDCHLPIWEYPKILNVCDKCHDCLCEFGNCKFRSGFELRWKTGQIFYGDVPFRQND